MLERQAGDRWDLQLRTNHELWLKENALNLGVARLPSDWQYMAWVDADVTFARDDWADETIHRLQHHPVIQMFSETADLSSEYEIVNRCRGFAYSHVHGVPYEPGKNGCDYDGYYAGAPAGSPFAFHHHPGFAWAMRRDAFDALGGLFDVAVIGEADSIMARAFVGKALKYIRPDYHQAYVRRIREWQERAVRHVRGNLGYMPGLLLHHWHGAKANRRYVDRRQVLVDSQYNPDADLKRDWQGLYQLTERSKVLRDGLQQYFQQRDEDAPTPR